MTQRPDSAVRASGPGAALQTAPSFSSRRKIASPVGSLIGSLANGVRRFSRLLPAQEKAAPDAFSIVPNSGFASTFDHGNGVSWSPSRTTTYWRPSRVNPPMPFSIVRGGTGTGVDAFFGDLSVLDPGTMSAADGHGAFRSSCGARSPRSPRRTMRATADNRRQSTSGIPSERIRNMPPGLSSHPPQRGSRTRLDSWFCTSSR